MDTHPDTVQAISTALGAVAGSLIRDRTTGAYMVQMEAKWNRLTKNRKKTRTNNSNKNYPQKEKPTGYAGGFLFFGEWTFTWV